MPQQAMSNYKKLEWIHFAIQEAQNGNITELGKALNFVEDIRESFIENSKPKIKQHT